MRSRRGEEEPPEEGGPAKGLSVICDTVISHHKIDKHYLWRKSLSGDIVNRYFKHFPLFVGNKSLVLWLPGPDQGRGGGCVSGYTAYSQQYRKGS